MPRIVDKACGIAAIDERRAVVATGLHGHVVEIGFGSGHNLPHLPETVSRLAAVDPSIVGKRLAARRLEACPVPVEFVGLDGQALPLADQSMDAALSTFTMCTIPDIATALRELRRVLRPGAELHFMEHGLSPDAAVAKWQHRLTPIQRRLCGGCHFNRAIGELIAANGFEITSLDNEYLDGPKPLGYLYRGTARRREHFDDGPPTALHELDAG